MATLDLSAIGELVLVFASAILRTGIQQFLNSPPTFSRHQRLVYTRVASAVPIEGTATVTRKIEPVDHKLRRVGRLWTPIGKLAMNTYCLRQCPIPAACAT